ncbi:anthranilate synthase component I family protein [Paenibacillus glycanilyticus]|uniref:anthranilate synthase component I family protein n=1 Tax=Paenibacillus glycanilyticus TaxID=126569 RepID=UPI00203D4B1E|nr:anthranilate synthase component I family protein [Paenibacillus glycanilyticus]MCM3631350.1 anthranilate synthase component I family protein [Paenibacillus glycanilyticus]
MFTAPQQWALWQAERTYTTLPMLKRIPLEAVTVDSWEAAWREASPHAFVLESGKDGRYTYLGLHPEGVIRGKGLQAESTEWDLQGRIMPEQHWEGKPLEVVRRWMEPYRSPKLAEGPKWTGGCVGFWSYDVIRSIERLPELAADDTGLPDYLFLRMNRIWIVDQQEKTLYCAVHTAVTGEEDEAELKAKYDSAVVQADEMAAFWQQHLQPQNGRAAAVREERRQFTASDSLHIDVESVEGITSPFRKEAFMDAVRRIQQYIGQGDVFQVNLSQRQSRKVSSSPEELYEWLRIFNPSPYMGFLRCPDFQLVSASPELLVERNGDKLATRPIAGTRRRGRSEEEDLQMAEELRTSEKERAEHIMLVDLERNDLGRISEFGTVKVEELMVIEYYSHVMHLVSQVEGRLADGRDAFDVIAATFPGGTITGAPKIRTMEIIEELEPVRRGPYTGSLGWIDYNGDMEFNIIIRTMAVKDGIVNIQAGAGIVIDSDPEREYYESLNKAKALWKAIQYSERFAEQTSRA